MQNIKITSLIPNFVIEKFTGYQETIRACLDGIEAGKVLRRRRLVWIKPNLVNDSPFPVTSDPEMIRAVIEYVRDNSRARIIIAEGCGDAGMETHQVFESLGYDKLAREYGVELVDLNNEALKRLSNPQFQVLPEIYLPRRIFSGMLISVPVLKRHSLAGVTLAMKNLLGLAPPKHYQQGGSWKKSYFHSRMQRSIFELNCYRKPDLSIVDARVGLAQYHLGGAECNPPVNRILAGFDPVAVDAAGTGLLGLSWKDVGHIRMAHKVLGTAKEI
ncbi:DUF362 domain-containing protein [Desulfonatronospira sp.]|uniref:DUF362 domain-containing protein n=1 Tax=Desulfonatronospira sp. TaxID=1962951 RepID=UPI0025C15580|nr:DUF362 domain-containing protein [Desulfonatronospira sp.]